MGLLAYYLLHLIREFYMAGEIDRLQQSDVLAFAKAFPDRAFVFTNAKSTRSVSDRIFNKNEEAHNHCWSETSSSHSMPL